MSALLAPPATWSFACPDWEDRIRRGASLVPPLPLDTAEAARAVAMFDMLRVPDLVGTPPLAEAAGEWFRDLIRPVFGSLVDNRRMVGELFVLAAKKNSKTTYSGGFMLVAMLMNERPRAEFLLLAPTQQVAEFAFNAMVGMIEEDPEGYLQKRFKVGAHIKLIEDLTNGASVQIKSFDAKVLTGVKPVGVLVDEIHEIAKNAAAERVLVQIRGGLQPFPESFLIFITTQSDEPPTGAFKAELNRARAIRDGRFTGRMLPVLYEFPEAIARDKAQWSDPANWHMVLPNLGRSITLDRLVEDFESKRVDGDAPLRTWASQHLNIEIGLGLRTDAWAGADFWEANALDALTLDTIIARCDVATIGYDGGGLDDLFGVSVIGRERGTRRWLAWFKAFAHRSVLERRKSEAAKLLDFARDGDLVIVERMEDAIAQAADIAMRLDDAGLLAEIGLDPAGAQSIEDELLKRGIDKDRMLGVSQGYKLNGTIKDVEGKLSDGLLRHGGQPLMNWCVANAKVEDRGNAILITKAASGKAKIDPLMAGFSAARLMMADPQPRRRRSIYDQGRNLLVV